MCSKRSSTSAGGIALGSTATPISTRCATTSASNVSRAVLGIEPRPPPGAVLRCGGHHSGGADFFRDALIERRRGDVEAGAGGVERLGEERDVVFARKPH